MDKKKAYVVSTAHLDTVWRWELAKTIEEFLPDTLIKNFDLIEKYPHYRFNFEGAYRYELIEEFYPKAFEQIKEYVKQGKWCVSGTAYENGDVNIPSPEALIRNILLGDRYFKTKFSTSSKDIFLPDCFGFGWALPSIIAHCGLKGFTTQKLSWGSAYGLPFDLGIWKGPDSKQSFICINAKSYRYKFTGDIRADLSVIDNIADNYQKGDLPWANHLYGTGDWGGSPTEESVRFVEESIAKNNDSDFEVVSASSDQVFDDLDNLSNEDKSKLPVWNNELVMTSHGAGAYTSRTLSKRLNSLNEKLASSTEKICLFAESIGAFKYPKDNINAAWKRVIRHQFHDDITGTSTVQVYNEAWRDYFNSAKQFLNEYTAAGKRIAEQLDTAWIGKNAVALIVNNPTQYSDTRVFEANVKALTNGKYLRVYDESGNEVPSQTLVKNGKNYKILVKDSILPFGYKVYKVIASDEPYKQKTATVACNEHSLENEKYKLRFNKNGDIAYLYDKNLKKEIISSPIKLAALHDTSSLAYPSWEIRKEDLDKEPYAYANTPSFTIVENGPCRVAVKVERELEYSKIAQTIYLESGGKYVEVKNTVDWNTRRSMLKAVFPFTANNQTADYDLGIGVIKRENNKDNLYEVPAQKWANITDNNGEFGISVFANNKYAWDKPNDNTLRLTCIHTPVGAFTKDARQDLQDLGQNRFSFAIYSHSGDWQNGTQKQNEIFQNPYYCFTTTPCEESTLSSEESFANINNDDVLIRAIKKSEDDDDFVIRVYESSGNGKKDVTITLMRDIDKVIEVNGIEEKIGNIKFEQKSFTFDLAPFETKSFKLRFLSPAKKIQPPRFKQLKLSYNAKGFSTQANMRNVILQNSGFSLPYELFENGAIIGGLKYNMFAKPDDRYDVLVCRGQEINVPMHSTVFHILMASTVTKRDAVFETIGKSTKKYEFEVKPMKMAEYSNDEPTMNAVIDNNIDNNFAFEFTHTHHPEGLRTDTATFCLYDINVAGAEKVILPEDNNIVILAITAEREKAQTKFASEIFDRSSNTEFDYNDIPPIDKMIDKAEFISIRAGKIQDQRNSGKGKGFKRDNLITNIIRSYTKSEW